MLTGREEEQYRLRKAYEDEYSQMVVIYGNISVGKTLLVEDTFDNNFCFRHTGNSREKTRKKQLEAFRISLKDYGHSCETPKNWLYAFDEQKTVIKASAESKKVIFMDEVAFLEV